MIESPQFWIPALVVLVLAIGFVFSRRGAVRGGQWTDIERLAVAPSVLILLLSYPLNHVWMTFWPGPTSGRIAVGRECWFLFWSLVAVGAVAERLWGLFLKQRGKAVLMPGLLASILRGLYVLAVALFVLRHHAGWNITPVLASTALATAVIGFALQGVLGNLMAGISMNLVRTFRPGDWISVRNIEGQVVHSDWRETRIRTTGLHMVVVPNSALAGELVTNFSQPDSLRRHEVFISTAFDAPPGKVIEALEAAAADVEGVVATPPPQAHVYEFGEWAVRYRLFFHTREYQKRSRIEGEVRDRMWYELRRRGLKLPEVLLTGPGVSPPVLAAVQTVVPDISAGMLLDGDFGRRFLRDAGGRPWVAEEELHPVVKQLRRLAFGPGEVIFRQGAAGSSCAIVLSGKLSGTIQEPEGGQPAVTFELAAGAIIGEMSLLLGQPRSATITAVGHVELIEIPEEAFRVLLGLRPEIPARLAHIAGERAANNEETRQAASKARPAPAEIEKGLLARFLRLLGGGKKQG